MENITTRLKIINEVLNARGQDEACFLSRVGKIYNSNEEELKEEFVTAFAVNPHNAETKFDAELFAKFWPYYENALIKKGDYRSGLVALAINAPEKFRDFAKVSANARSTGNIDPVDVFGVYMSMFGDLCIDKKANSFPKTMTSEDVENFQQVFGGLVDFLSGFHVSTVYGMAGFSKVKILDKFLGFVEKEWNKDGNFKSLYENNIIDGFNCILRRESETEDKTFMPRILNFMRERLHREKTEKFLRKYDLERIEDYFEFAEAKDVVAYINSIGGLVDENGRVDFEQVKKIEFMFKRIETLANEGKFNNKWLIQFAKSDFINLDVYANALQCDRLSEVAQMVKLASHLGRKDLINKLRGRFVTDKDTTVDTRSMLEVLVADPRHAFLWAEKLSTKQLTMDKVFELCKDIITLCPENADDLIDVIYCNAKAEHNTNAQVVTSLLGINNDCYSTLDIEKIIAGNENSIGFLENVKNTYECIAKSLCDCDFNEGVVWENKARNAMMISAKVSRLLNVRINAVKKEHQAEANRYAENNEIGEDLQNKN